MGNPFQTLADFFQYMATATGSYSWPVFLFAAFAVGIVSGFVSGITKRLLRSKAGNQQQ